MKCVLNQMQQKFSFPSANITCNDIVLQTFSITLVLNIYTISQPVQSVNFNFNLISNK